MNLGIGKQVFAYPEILRERLFPLFTTFTDELYARIKNLPEAQQSEASLRLGAVLYTLGIAMHPYDDGNGQTFRLMALSYIHELAGEQYEQSYFPYKFTAEDGESIKSFFTDTFADIDVFYDLPPAKAKRFREYKNTINMMELYKGRFGYRKEDRQALQKKFSSEELREFSEKMTYYNQKRAEIGIQEEKRDPTRWVGRQNDNVAQAHAFLDYLLASAQGRTVVADFVLENYGSERIDNSLPLYKQVALETFKKTRDAIKEALALEPKEQHSKKYQIFLQDQEPNVIPQP